MAPILKLKFKKIKVAQKANSESGIPADILGLHFGRSAYPLLDWLRILFLAPFYALHLIFRIHHWAFDCYLVEMGVDDPTPPKNMEYLLTILQPDVGIVLNALPVHAEQFERTIKRSDLGVRQGRTLIETIAIEKGKLITKNPNLKLAILNADQPEINSLKPVMSGARIYTFGKTPKSTVRILSIKPSLEGTEITLHYNKLKYFIKLNRLALPDFYAFTFAAAFAVGISLGLEPETVADTISAGFVLPPGRGQIFEGIKDSIIIDSSYNASGETVQGSLNLLKTAAGKRRKIAVLGDMRELGNQAEKEHLAAAKTILETADQVVLVGPLMKQYALPSLLKFGKPVNWFLTAGEAVRFLSEGSHPSDGKDAILRGGAVILVKGSQNTIFLEIVVEALLSNKADKEKLCRRGKFWDRQRKPYI